MILLYVFAFTSGLITIFAPCIWPILPIVLSAGTQAGHRRPLGITLGLMVSFSSATLALSFLVRNLGLNAEVLRWLAVATIIGLGMVLLIPALGARLEAWVSRLQGKLNVSTKTTGSGWWGGFVTGLALGLIWTPCAGPILATIITLASTQTVTLAVVFLTIAYSVGVAVPLFIITFAGQAVMRRVKTFNRYTGKIQQVFGGVMILTAILIATGYDRTLQTKLLTLFPSYGQFVVDLESTDSIQDELDALRGSDANQNKPTDSNHLLATGYPAPELEGLQQWFNSQPLTLAELKGKVVLVDFWTYTCINCIRTLPHMQAWHEAYSDDGLVMIGVHSPEFEFEKDPANLQAAIDDYGLTYPVVQDNDFATWFAYNNRYWPAKYLIDAEGNIRYTHFGEGEYAETEQAIRALLAEANQMPTDPLTELPDETPQYVTTPETYLGAGRVARFASNEAMQIGIQNYTAPAELPLHSFAFKGEWSVASQYAEPNVGSELVLHYKAAEVYLVIEPQSLGSSITVNGVEMTLTGDRLYTLVSQDQVVDDTVSIIFNDPNTQVFAFTFGS